MIRRHQLPLALALVLAGSALASRAEVSCNLDAPDASVVQMSVAPTSSPDIWQVVGPTTTRVPLNEVGLLRGDIEPAIALDGLSRQAVAVWQYWDGEDFEIAFSRCIVSSWTPHALLTENTTADIAPRVAVGADGAIGVSWIQMGNPSVVKYREFEPGIGWSPIIDVNAAPTTPAAPSLLFWGSTPRIAYVEDRGPSEITLVVAGGDDPAPWPFVFEPEIIAQLNVGLDPEPELFAGSDRLVATWVDSATHVGFASRANGVWSAPQYEPYVGTADLGRARLRAKVRALRAP
jgi:hypothetical protein